MDSVLACKKLQEGKSSAVSSQTTVGAIISGGVWLKVHALQTSTQSLLSTHPNTVTDKTQTHTMWLMAKLPQEGVVPIQALQLTANKTNSTSQYTSYRSDLGVE